MTTWKVGAVTITSVVETMLEVPAEVMIEAVSPESVAPYVSWLEPNYLTAECLMRVAVQSLLIESDGLKIIVDTCFGNDRNLPYPGMEPLHSDFLEKLAEAGFAREDVNVVLCTHLHHDHVGWNTMLVDGRWVPTFPHARYLFGQVEYEHWQTEEDFNIDLTDNVEPVVAAGLHQFVEMDHVLTPDVALEPTPGHTPGHVSVRIRSGGEEALISGDMIHHPVQIVEQGWPSVPDFDPERAVATRRAALAALANTDVLVIGTHFADPAGGHIRRDGETWAWAPQT